MKPKSNIYVDIDETICDYEYGDNKRDYYLARPIIINIEKINRLYDEGHTITYYTARASTLVDRREEFTALTIKQLKEWGCKYHNVSVGDKPPYDILICDKSRRIEEIL